jgi:hypothetical protein
VRADGLAAPACCLADLPVRERLSASAWWEGEEVAGEKEWHTILYMGTEPYENATVPRIMLSV